MKLKYHHQSTAMLSTTSEIRFQPHWMLKKIGNRLLIRGTSLLPAILLAAIVHAHPHIFIDSSMEIIFDQKGMAGIQMRWVFDEMTSSGFIVDYDTNRDGRFSDAEKRIMKKEAFDYLRNYEYMTHIEIDGKTFNVRYVKDFEPVIKGDRLIYSFLIPCHVSAAPQDKRITIAVYDSEYYVDFNTKKDAIQLTNHLRFKTDSKIWTNRNKSYYFEQFHPQEFVLTFKK